MTTAAILASLLLRASDQLFVIGPDARVLPSGTSDLVIHYSKPRVTASVGPWRLHLDEKIRDIVGVKTRRNGRMECVFWGYVDSNGCIHIIDGCEQGDACP